MCKPKRQCTRSDWKEASQSAAFVRLTELCFTLDARDVAPPLNRLPENGELGLFIRSDKAAEDGLPERVGVLEQVLQARVLLVLQCLQGTGSRAISYAGAVARLDRDLGR
jgi:hypothetical protein